MPLENTAFWDLLWDFIYLSVIVAAIVYVWMFHSLVKYRFKEGDPLPEDSLKAGYFPAERDDRRLEAAWTIGPTLLIIFLAYISMDPLNEIWEYEEDPTIIEVEASQWVWVFTYPNGTSSTNELYVEHGDYIELHMISTDVLHSLWIPDLGLKEDVLPGYTTVMPFNTRNMETGEYEIVCTEFCGDDHYRMTAVLIVG